jgi:signal transduction histidine kinase
VGNVLNSVSTSGQLIQATLDQSKIGSLIMANQLMEEHRDDIARFLSEDTRGQKLMDFYLFLGTALLKEQDSLAENITLLLEKVETIKNVVAQQHNYASGIYQVENINLVEAMETALKIVGDSMGYAGVEVFKNYLEVPAIPVQKTKLIHCLINLIKNAIESMREARPEVATLWLRVYREGPHARAEVQDNGTGISPENLGRVFSHGFTTKEKGHGFGLHSCANAVREMGGTISVESEGDGEGAVFIIQLPLMNPVTLAT